MRKRVLVAKTLSHERLFSSLVDRGGCRIDRKLFSVEEEVIGAGAARDGRPYRGFEKVERFEGPMLDFTR